jgi:methanogenesis imperfect marker protein 11
MPRVLRPDEVRAEYGKMFCQGFYTMVDEKAGVAKIVEKCVARGPVEWDVVNRKRTGGVITDIDVQGYTMIMDTVIGERPLNFGPVSADLGGQGLSSLTVEGDRVRTKWAGLAGATVGIGACIPQGPGVIETVYPDDFKIGGAHHAHVEIVTPKMIRVIIGIDDTDTKERGATWAMAMRLGTSCPIGVFLDHKIIQLNPKAPNKTTNCCSTAVAFAVKEDEADALVAYCRDFILRESFSADSVMTVFKGLHIPEDLAEFSWNAKSILYKEEDAMAAAALNNVEVIPAPGTKGVIGAVAAIGCFDMGVRSAGVPEDFE